MSSAIVRTPSSPDLAQLAADERDLAAEVLAAAFRDNPLNRAVIGDSADRRLRSNRFGSRAALEVAIGPAHCRVAREAGAIRAVLVAEAPGARPLPLPTLATQLRCLYGQGWRVARRWNRVHFELQQHHPAQPHWYLDLLGTAPDAQGRGLGSALLRELLERVDVEGASSYLETDRSANLPFYERAGYAVLGEERVLGVRVWRMWRPAARAQCLGSTEGENDVR
jgi:GNAT superfamily N-acetyltransferase